MKGSDWGNFDPDARVWEEMEIPATGKQGMFSSHCDCTAAILTGQR